MKYRIKPEYSYGRAKFSIYEVKTRKRYLGIVWRGRLRYEDEESESYVTFGISMADAEEIVKHLCSEVKEVTCSQSQ